MDNEEIIKPLSEHNDGEHKDAAHHVVIIDHYSLISPEPASEEQVNRLAEVFKEFKALIAKEE